MEFYVLLCYDVIIEVLQYGNRQRLTKLERIGRRYHRIAENYFGKYPFLRLNLILQPPDLGRLLFLNIFPSSMFSYFIHMSWHGD